MGLIPACAGKTARAKSRCPMKKAHPRVCGENPMRMQSIGDAKGSSPRVRGKPGFMVPIVFAPGLIPACAGKTFRGDFEGCAVEAHPRVCGENPLFLSPRITTRGSSPRVRGKPRQAGKSFLIRGLIPACAGKTRASVIGVSFSGAHPRVCGENSLPSQAGLTCPGSSPRVRGKPTISSSGRSKTVVLMPKSY